MFICVFLFDVVEFVFYVLLVVFELFMCLNVRLMLSGLVVYWMLVVYVELVLVLLVMLLNEYELFSVRLYYFGDVYLSVLFV